MRDHLIAVVKEIGRKAGTGNWTGHVQFGQTGSGHFWCGYGYFDRDAVLWWPPWNPGEPEPSPEQLSVEDGVGRFLSAYELEGEP